MDRKTLIRIIVLFVVALVIAVGTLFASFSIPANRFYARIGENIETLSWRSQFYPSIIEGRNFSRIDNYTDAIMLQLSIDNPQITLAQQVFAPMMLRAFPDEVRELPNTVKSLEARYLEGAQPDYAYGRYWHGYRVPLRLLGSLFNLQQLRIFNYLCLGLLFAVSCYCVQRLYNRATMLLFASSLMAVSIYFVPMSLQFVSVFYIQLISVIALCISLERQGERAWVPEIVALSAMAVAFFDFFTSPLVVIGFLSILYALWLYRRKQTSAQVVGKKVAQLYGLWLVVYAAFWGIKGLIAPLFGVRDLGTSSARQAAKHIVDASGSDWIHAIPYNLATLMGATSLDTNVKDIYYWLYVGSFFALVALSAYLWLTVMNRTNANWQLSNSRRFAPLVAIALSPFIWLQFKPWQSANHAFVYRELSIFIFGLGAFYVLSWYQAKVQKHSPRLTPSGDESVEPHDEVC